MPQSTHGQLQTAQHGRTCTFPAHGDGHQSQHQNPSGVCYLQGNVESHLRVSLAWISEARWKLIHVMFINLVKWMDFMRAKLKAFLERQNEPCRSHTTGEGCQLKLGNWPMELCQTRGFTPERGGSCATGCSWALQHTSLLEISLEHINHASCRIHSAAKAQSNSILARSHPNLEREWRPENNRLTVKYILYTLQLKIQPYRCFRTGFFLLQYHWQKIQSNFPWTLAFFFMCQCHSSPCNPFVSLSSPHCPTFGLWQVKVTLCHLLASNAAMWFILLCSPE